ncbi:MAG: hypothetical protein IT285_13245 [Bdellovibrionales bacterium]|nr:hypothetical protein [Bdellovibrionales bacterium]
MTGAFADGAVLFPLVALLTVRAGFDGTILLASAGATYVVAAKLFGVPMGVQPLKSIAVAAIAMGANMGEVRLSGALLGVACILIALSDPDRWAGKVPASVTHQVQAGLGVLLVMQGLEAAGGSEWGLGGLALGLLMVLKPELGGLPLMGLMAFAGILWALWDASPGWEGAIRQHEYIEMRWGIVVSLVLPQIALTSANSILAARDTAHRYFGSAARNVTCRRLSLSIGLGNLLSAAVGGLPFCHGSGAITAHARCGSTRAWSTGLMGIVLLVLAFRSWSSGGGPLVYSPVLVAGLLFATGLFHVKLAQPMLGSRAGLLRILGTVLITVATRNLLWTLAWAVATEAALRAWVPRGKEAHS